MAKKTKMIIYSPGGNITGLVLGQVAVSKQASLARKIIHLHKNIEQVGYVTKTKTSQALARLQMMGNEFCGNAARSLAYAITQGLIPFVKPPKLPARFSLEVSGASGPTDCLVKNNNVVQADMPIPVLTPTYQVCHDYHIVHLEGISYILVPNPSGSIRQAKKILKRRDFRPCRATGVIYYHRQPRNIITTESYVFVRETRSLIPETSSGTGAIATAIKEAYQDKKAVSSYTIIPPSGIPIKTIVRLKDDIVQRAYIKGPVEILGIEEIYI